MRPRLLHFLIAALVALTAAGSVTAWAGAQPPTVSVHVQRKLSVTGNVHVSFRPTDPLPVGGYYYAVIVLNRYKHYTRNEPPPCATSSNMQRTDYGYPHPGHPVGLAITPATSAAGHWCRGGVYSGGIYAVPQPPPCESTYPCLYAEPYKAPSPCWEIEPGHKVCGVVAKPRLYRYPDGLPTPLAKGTRIVGHFQVSF
jgi:hypothetical protein